MSEEVVDFAVKISGDPSGAIRAYQLASEAGERTARVAQRVSQEGVQAAARHSSALSRVASTAAGVAAGFGLFRAASSAFSFAGQAVLGFNQQLENARIGFTTMLGSGKAADAMLRQLQTFAKTTPFEFKDVVDASGRLMAMGVSAKNVIPTLTAVGDAVAAVGGGKEKIDRVVTALGQIQAKGRAQADEMLQLTEAGIPAWQFLADKIGTSIPQAMKKVSAGSIDAATAISAVTDGIEGKFGGMMAKQSQTMQGALSNMKDGATQALATAFKPLFDGIEKGAMRAADLLGSAGVAGAAKQMGSQVASALSGAMAALASLSKGDFSGFAKHLGLSGSAAKGLSSAMGSLVGIAKSAWSLFKDFLPVIRDVAVVLGVAVVGALAILNPALKFLADHGQLVAGIVETLGAGFLAYKGVLLVVAAATKAYALVQAALNLVMDANPIGLIIAALAMLAVGITIAWKRSETFRDIVRTAFAAVQTAVYAFAYGAVTYIKFFLNVWLTVVGAVLHAAAVVEKALHLGNTLQGMDASFKATKDSILGTVDELQSGLKAKMEAAARDTAMRAALTAAAISKPIQDRLPLYEQIASKYGMTLPEALKKADLPASEAAKLMALHTAQELAAGKAAMRNASTYMTAIPRQAIIDGTAGARRSSYELGLGLGDGVLAGISNRTAAVTKAAYSMGNNAAVAARHGADVRSPSGITLYAGEMLAEGFIVGMRSRLSAVVAASQELAAAATAGTVNVADLKAAQARALETPVERAQLADVNAASAFDSARSAAVGPNAAATAAATAQRAAQVRDDAARARLKALTSATSAAVLAARDHTRALQAAAAAASLHAAQMPGHTKAQQAAKNAAQDYARTLSFQASAASRAATAVSQHNAVAIKAARDQVAAADKALSAAKAAASATASAAKDANQAVTDAATAAVEAHAALADAVYADSVAKVQAFAGDISKQLDVLVAKADTMRSAFSGAALANSSLADLFKAPDGATGIGSLDAALAAMQTRVTDAKGLADQISQLQGAGLSADLINQISAAGTGTGSAMATAILAGGPEAIAQLNDLSTQLAAVAASGIDGVVGAFYGQGAMSVQQLAEGMRAGFPEIDAVLGEIAAKVTAVLGTSGITPGSANIPSPTPSGSGAVTIIVQPAPTTVTLDGKVIAENSQQHLLQKKTISGSLGLS